MMRQLVLTAVLTTFLGVLGCSGPGLSTAPLTEEQKQKIREDDKRIDDEERGGSGTAVPAKKKR